MASFSDNVKVAGDIIDAANKAGKPLTGADFGGGSLADDIRGDAVGMANAMSTALKERLHRDSLHLHDGVTPGKK